MLHQAAEGAADTRDLPRLADISARVSNTPMASQAATGLLALTTGRPADAARILLEISARDWPELPPAVPVVSNPDADAIEAS